MVLDELHLKNYRNICDEKISFDTGINILFGKNANGKTNMLEAVYQFSVGRSFRVKNLREVINFEKDECQLFLACREDNTKRATTLSIKINKHKEKKYSVNGMIQDKISGFLGNFKSVLFTPDNLSLIKGSPESRRKFIDMAICQIKPIYVNVLNGYIKLLSQRNALLKQMKRQNTVSDEHKLTELSVWTEKMIYYSSVITRYRGEYINSLKTYAPLFYAGLSGERENMQIAYLTQTNKYDSNFQEWNNQSQNEKLYNTVFEKNLHHELRYGISLYGCHRDDLIIDIDNKSARYIASQGQQRSAVLSLKLAEGEIMKCFSGEYPVFLFDDIMSELDRERQNFILEKLHGRQVIITCCNDDYFKIIKAAKIINVENGKFLEYDSSDKVGR